MNELRDSLLFIEATIATLVYTGLAVGVVVVGLWALIERKAKV